MPLKKRLVEYRNITIIKRGMNRSSLFSIISDCIILNFFKIKSIMTGMTNVVMKTMAKLMSALNDDNLNIPDVMNINNIHVGNKTGCANVDISFANLFISYFHSSLRRRATGMSSCSRYLAMVLLAML